MTLSAPTRSKTYIVLSIALCFVVGFATERWIGKGATPSIRTKDPESVSSSNNHSPLTGRSSESTQPETGESAWYEKDYSGNWNEMLSVVLSLKPQDESLRHLLPRIRNYSTGEAKALFKATLGHSEKNRLSLIVGWAFQAIVLDSFGEGVRAFSEISPDDQRQFAWLAANSLSQNDPERAWAWLDSVELGDPKFSIHPNQLPALRSMALGNMLFLPDKHVRSLELAQSVSDVRVRESLTDRVVTAMLDQNMDQAMDDLKEFPELIGMVTDKMIQKWAEEDTTMASNYLKDNPDIITRKRLVEVAKNLVNKGDYQEFNHLYESLDSERMKSFMAYRAATHHASSDVDESINWIRTIPDGMSRRQAGAAAIREMGYTDNLEAHTQVIEAAYDGFEQERYELYRETLEIWQKKHPEKVVAVIRNLPDDDRNLRDALEASLIEEGDRK